MSTRLLVDIVGYATFLDQRPYSQEQKGDLEDEERDAGEVGEALKVGTSQSLFPLDEYMCRPRVPKQEGEGQGGVKGIMERTFSRQSAPKFAGAPSCAVSLLHLHVQVCIVSRLGDWLSRTAGYTTETNAAIEERTAQMIVASCAPVAGF